MCSQLTYRERYAQLRDIEDQRKVLVENLLDEVDNVRKGLKALEMERDRERDASIYFHRNLEVLKADLKSAQGTMDLNAFVIVLVDGDCMNFLDKLVTKLEAGGEEAAQLLRNSVATYIKTKLTDLNPDVEIVVRVYANLRGLGKALADNTILEHHEDLGRFICGFNKKYPFFDFVDAGNGKECSDAKLKKLFELYIRNVHCKHVVFGGSADNGYARLLSPYTGDQSMSKRITMLEGPPFARELAQIVENFQQCSFPGVFRNAKLLPRTVSFSTTAPESVSPKLPSYATTAASAKVGGPDVVVIPKTDPQAEGIVPINSKGQRVDLPIKVSQTTVNSLRSRKWCNNHYLMGYCGYPNCSYEHNVLLNETQKNALRTMARQAPCALMLDCDDPDCFFGHRCPGNPCTWGTSCKFPAEMHNVDTKAVNC